MYVADSQTRALELYQQILATPETTTVPFRGQQLDVPRVRVPSSLLVYRINNGRTRVAQLRHIEKNALPTGFFEGKQENSTVQAAQHKLLLELSQDPKANIYEELAHIRAQREPLIVTRRGVVVNGNRRLAAMRDLAAQDASSYGMYAHVDVAVLPETTTEEDIEEIETELQEVPQMRLEYGWIDRRLKLRYQLEALKIKPEVLRVKYRLRGVEDINRELQQLSLAEDYLSFAGKPRHYYWEIAQGEEIFKRLQQALSKSTPDKLELRRLVGFNLIAAGQRQGRAIDDRLYKYHPMFGGQLDRIAERYAREHTDNLNSMTGRAAGPHASQDSDDPLSELAYEVAREPESALLAGLKTRESGVEVIRDLVRTYDSLVEEQREGDRRRVAQSNAQTALRLVTEIDVSQISSTEREAVLAALSSLYDRAAVLIDQIGAL